MAVLMKVIRSVYDTEESHYGFEECQICWDEAPRSAFMELSCGHDFMKECLRDCILNWVKSN